MRFDGRSKAVRALKAADPRLAKVIEAVGPVGLSPPPDRFAELAAAIVYQQLSLKAAGTIWGRFEQLGPVTPEAVAGLPHERMRGVGLSNAKARYVKDLAEHVVSGRLDLHAIDDLDDEAVIEALTEVKGIGRWTAEMFLIFGMGRLDVLSTGDAGLLRAARLLAGGDGPADAETFTAMSDAWRPYRSVASLYLWKSLEEDGA